MSKDHSTQPWSLAETKAFFGEMSDSYDDTVSIVSYPAPFLIADWLINLISEDSIILDIGCGTGVSSLPFFNIKNFKVVGIDATPEMLEKAKLLPFEKLICEDMEIFINDESNFNSFNAAVCVGVVDFVVNVETFLKNVYNLLTADGFFGLTIPCDGEFNAYSDLELALLISNCWFKIEKKERIFGYEDTKSGLRIDYWAVLLKKI